MLLSDASSPPRDACVRLRALFVSSGTLFVSSRLSGLMCLLWKIRVRFWRYFDLNVVMLMPGFAVFTGTV